MPSPRVVLWFGRIPCVYLVTLLCGLTKNFTSLALARSSVPAARLVLYKVFKVPKRRPRPLTIEELEAQDLARAQQNAVVNMADDFEHLFPDHVATVLPQAPSATAGPFPEV